MKEAIHLPLFAASVLSLYAISCNNSTTISKGSDATNTQDTAKDVLVEPASGGVLVSVAELMEIKRLSGEGQEPHATNVAEFIKFVDSLNKASEEWPDLSGEVVVDAPSSDDPVQLSSDGAKLVYGLAMAWHLTGDEAYARRAREMILDLTDTYGYRDKSTSEFRFGGQGTLNLARGVCQPLANYVL